MTPQEQLLDRTQIDVQALNNDDIFYLLDATVAEILKRYGKEETARALKMRTVGMNHLTSTKEMNLSARAFNVLWHSGIYTLEQLLVTRAVDVYTTRNCGKKTFREIVDAVRRYGNEEWGKYLVK
jgi:DNA-directed RNA polymerase alpha subunit